MHSTELLFGATTSSYISFSNVEQIFILSSPNWVLTCFQSLLIWQGRKKGRKKLEVLLLYCECLQGESVVTLHLSGHVGGRMHWTGKRNKGKCLPGSGDMRMELWECGNHLFTWVPAWPHYLKEHLEIP